MDLSSKSVLLVEDDKINQGLCRIHLNKIGIKDIDLAVNGLEAVEMFSKRLYDVIIMDIFMPVMDGFDAAVEIRKTSNTETKIIAYTSDYHFKNNNVLFDGKIIKPATIDQINKAILDVLMKDR